MSKTYKSRADLAAPLVAEIERLRQNEKQLTMAVMALFQERDALLLALHLMKKSA